MPVGFPSFNIWFDIDKIAFNIGNINIYWYGILIALAYIISLSIVLKDIEKYEIKKEQILKIILISVFFGILGARLFYVVFCQNDYNDFKQIINIRNGGLSIFGGFIFAFISIYFFSKKYKLNILNILDLLVPATCLCQFIGRLGNFINQEAYGIATEAFWKMSVFENGEYINVHPTFLYEMLITGPFLDIGTVMIMICGLAEQRL